jgi:ABC-2 type transport system ATP-binding protein
MRVAIGIVQVLLMVGGPLAIAAWLRARWRLPWGLWGAAAAGFIASQIVHLPLLYVVLPHVPNDLAIQCAVVGLLAGVCEEPARWLVFRYWQRDAKTFEQGVFAGLGHGGIESIVLGLLVAQALLGSAGVAADAPDDVRAAAVATLGANPLERILGALERGFAITFHVGMAIVVMNAVVRKRPSLLVLAIALHTFADAAALAALKTRGIVAAEITGALFAALAVFIILYARASERRAREAARDVVDRNAEPARGQAISARALTKRFADRAAVDALTVDVANGRVFALLGPNGAGKTTTVRMLAALIPPTSGTARVADALLVSEADALRTHVGILTETPGLYERLTAYENLDLFGRLYGLDPTTRAARIERHLRAFDIWERKDEPVSGFSKGMKQKIAIVRALVHEPAVLFLDEPTTGLDPVASREVHDMILALKKEGRTILLTTHRLVEAEQLADIVGIVKTRLLALDTVDNLTSRTFGKELEVRIGNPSHAIAAALRAVPGLESGAWEGGVFRVATSDSARTPAIVRALVGAGADVLAVGESKHSLEDVYLELVKEGE